MKSPEFMQPLGSLIILLIAAFISTAALAAYPEHSITIIVGTAPGGTQDLLPRLIAPGLSAKLGQPVVIQNMPGASTTLAAAYVARSKPDGYNLFIAGPNLAIPIGVKLEYDPIKSFAPIAELVSSPGFFMVSPSLHVTSMKELIALAKSKPGQLNYAGGAGQATPHDIVVKLLARRVGIDLTPVAYNGGAKEIAALLSGEVQLAVGGIESIPEVQAGKLVALAVTSSERSPALPNLPTVAEAADVPGFSLVNWFGLLAPSGTPKEVITALHDGIAETLKSPDVMQKITQLGYTPEGGSPDEFGRIVAKSVTEWGSLFEH